MSKPSETTTTTKNQSEKLTSDVSSSSEEVTLFVGNIPYEMSQTVLENLFKEEGVEPKKVFIKCGREGYSKGFGFVHLNNASEANIAIEKLNRKQIGRMRLRVNIADPESPHLNRRAEGSGEHAQRRPVYREREYGPREYTARDFSPREYTARDTAQSYGQSAYGEREYRAPYREREYRAPAVRLERTIDIE